MRSGFIATAASLLRPGGFLFAATLNRTLKSYALAIVGADNKIDIRPVVVGDERRQDILGGFGDGGEGVVGAGGLDHVGAVDFPA